MSAKPYFNAARKTVSIDDNPAKSVDILPHVEEKLTCAEHQVRLEVEGFIVDAATRFVTVQDGQISVARFTLLPKPSRLTVISNISGAEVLDATGKHLGVAGEVIEIPALSSLITLSIRATGYTEQKMRFDGSRMEPGKSYEHRVTLEEQRGPSFGQSTRIADLGLDLIWVEAGNFRMGSADGRDNGPASMVQITRGLWIGKTEVTQAQWFRIMGDDPSYFKGKELPVESVSWNACADFCRKLTERERQAARLPTGYVYRLPTEAEWEYAARGGNIARNTTLGVSGDPNSTVWNSGDIPLSTYPVGTKDANELGIYDMSGNVWEWVYDWHQRDYLGSATTDPKGPAYGCFRVRRGGGWLNDVRTCSAANRFKGGPSNTSSVLGFRVVLGPVL
ncbi:MAG TPA: SUMF1/EgtB/PvdO family nonheme iron enzyme [Verrucomicrobiota bacterium]|nr:SUMF1/EgtB/PvdO family nonheme iron enzyme [Verrucomicrobiota bacterium]